MRLKLLTPSRVAVDREAVRITARSVDGYFCLLPHHVDFVSELQPGILSFEDSEGVSEAIAVDEGILVKCGGEVLIASRNAIVEPGLNRRDAASAHTELEAEIVEEEQKCREIVAGLEADFVNGFLKQSRER